MALTASATPLYVQNGHSSFVSEILTVVVCRVQDDIARSLGMDSDQLFKFIHPFNRPNLFYEVCIHSLYGLKTSDERGWPAIDSVPFFRRWDSPDGRGLELHQRSAPSTRKTVYGHHLLSDARDMR
jgi:hypothetical protein